MCLVKYCYAADNHIALKIKFSNPLKMKDSIFLKYTRTKKTPQTEGLGVFIIQNYFQV